MATEIAVSILREAWATVRERFAVYDLLSPGDSTFECLSTDCPAHCCRKYSVSLGQGEVDRMVNSSGLLPSRFLETENGEPIAFPLAQPFMLSRTDGACTLLGPDLLCGQYEGRPDACRQYPHHVLFIDRANGKPVYGDLERMAEGMSWFLSPGAEVPACVPILIRHLDCPGFDGPPLKSNDWTGLMDETVRLQYADLRPLLPAALA